MVHPSPCLFYLLSFFVSPNFLPKIAKLGKCFKVNTGLKLEIDAHDFTAQSIPTTAAPNKLQG